MERTEKAQRIKRETCVTPNAMQESERIKRETCVTPNAMQERRKRKKNVESTSSTEV